MTLRTILATAALALVGCSAPPEGLPVEELCIREVEELHRFFEDWFRGRIASSDEGFARFAGALSERFEISPPEGEVLDRETILAAVRGAHGTWGEGSRIWIEQASARLLGDGMLEAIYEEWQDVGGVIRGRASRALMRQSTSAPNGVQWVRVEETWIE